MTKLILGATVIVFALLLPPAAHSGTRVLAPASPVPYQQWVDASLTPTPPIDLRVSEIQFGDDACGPSAEPACTYPHGPIIIAPMLFLEDPGHPWGELRNVFLHELGHQFDYAVMTEADRTAFRALIRDERPWRGEGGNSAHEQFAEAYANCAMNRKLKLRLGERRGWFGYGYRPSREEFRSACRLIRNAYWF